MLCCPKVSLERYGDDDLWEDWRGLCLLDMVFGSYINDTPYDTVFMFIGRKSWVLPKRLWMVLLR